MTLFDEKPLSSGIVPRYYQEEMRDNSLDNVLKKKHRGTLCVAPMGAGKSLGMALTAVRASELTNRGVLILAHLKGLVRGNRRAVEQLGRSCYIHYGDEKDVIWPEVARGAIVSASVQSMTLQRLAKIKPETVGLILIDEGHHGILNSHYETIKKHFGNCPVILYTATPERADGEPLVSNHALCESVAVNYQIRQFVKEGWILNPLTVYEETVKLDFSVIRETDHEISEAACEKIWEAYKAEYAVIKPLIKMHEGMQTVGFAPSVRMAKLWSELVNDDLPGLAEYVASYKPSEYIGRREMYNRDDRDDVEERFENGFLRFLFNQGVYTEGADLVAAQLCMMGLMLFSKSAYAQRVGRVLRVGNVTREDGTKASVISGLERATDQQRLDAIAASHKPHALIVDYAGASGPNKLQHPVNLFCDNHTPPKVVEIAKGIIEEKIRKYGSADNEEAMQEAEEKYKRFLVTDAKVRRSIAVDCETMTRDINPWSGEDVTPGQRYIPKKRNPAPPSVIDSIKKATRELGKTYSEQFYKTLTQGKAFSVLKGLKAEQAKKRSSEPCPSWVIDKLKGAGVYDRPVSYQDGIRMLQKTGVKR